MTMRSARSFVLWGTAIALAAMISAAPQIAAAASPVEAANRFAQTLSGHETKAVLPYESPARTEVRLTPGPRKGLMLSEMDGETRKSAFDLLRSLLSAQGMRLVEAVIEREKKLGEIEGDRDYRDPEKYTLAVFGRPGKGKWSVRYEGHHLSINIDFDGPEPRSVLPFLIGANPPEGPAGDELLPFVLSAKQAPAFLSQFTAFFAPGTPIPRAADVDIDLSTSYFGGHPHLVVTGR